LQEFDLSDDHSLSIKGQTYFKSDVLRYIDELEDPILCAYHQIIYEKRNLCDFLMGMGLRGSLPAKKEIESLGDGLIEYISPYFTELYGKHLLNAFKGGNAFVVKSSLEMPKLCIESEMENCYLLTHSHIEHTIISELKAIEDKLDKGNCNTAEFPNLIKKLSIIVQSDTLNLLPSYFQEQRNQIAEGLRRVALSFEKLKADAQIGCNICQLAISLTIDGLTQTRVLKDYSIWQSDARHATQQSKIEATKIAKRTIAIIVAIIFVAGYFELLKPVWTLMLIIVMIWIAAAFHQIGTVFALKLSGIKIKKISVFYGKPIFKIKVRGISFEIGYLPTGGSIEIDDEKYAALRSFMRILIHLSGPTLVLVSATLILGSGAAFQEFINGFAQIVRGSLSPIVVGSRIMASFLVVLHTKPMLVSAAILATKFAAINLLPIPYLNGGKILTEIIPAFRKIWVMTLGLLASMCIVLTWLAILLIQIFTVQENPQITETHITDEKKTFDAPKETIKKSLSKPASKTQNQKESLSDQIDSKKARASKMELALEKQSRELESIGANLDALKNTIRYYENQTTLSPSEIDVYNSKIEEHNRIVASSNAKVERQKSLYTAYSSLIDSINAMVAQYNQGRR